MSPEATMKALEDFYVMQYHFNSTSNPDCCFLSDVFQGQAVKDPQVWAIYPKNNVNQPPKSNWPGDKLPHPANNQAFVGIDNDAGCMLTFRGDTITFESWHPPDDRGYSRHYIMEGPATHPNPLPGGTEAGDEDDKKIIRLWGWDYAQKAPDVSIRLDALNGTSYGINGVVKEKEWNPKQLLVMDANELVLEVAKNANRADFLDEALAPRHNNKVNYARCDGSVDSSTAIDLEIELKKPDGIWYFGR